MRVGSQNVLVTGGTGFVGSHLVERLLETGHAVTCLVRDPRQLRWLKGLNVRLIQGDCSDPGSLVNAVKHAEVVIHVAGLTKAPRSRDFYTVNHIGTRNILEACAAQALGIKKFILISSLAAAGPSPDGRPVTDDDVPCPVSDYGNSKLLAEKEALRFKDEFPVVILRPSAVYGPRDTDVYELFRWASRGITLELAGGERYINPCYVEDLTAAMLLAAERDVPSGSIYFVAESKAYSWTEFRQTLLSSGGVKARNIKIPYVVAYLVGLVSEAAGLVIGKPAVTSRQKIKEASQKYWVCELSKTERELGFRPLYPLRKGMEKTWKWYREQGWL